MSLWKNQLPSTRAQLSEEVKAKLLISINSRLSEAQRSAGLLAKCTVSYDEFFSIDMDVWKAKESSSFRLSVVNPKNAKEQFVENLVLKMSFVSYMRSLVTRYLAGDATVNEPRKFNGEYIYSINDECFNDCLGIENIILDGSVTDKQLEKGIIAKATIETPIATIRGITVNTSRFSKDVYVTIPMTGSGVLVNTTRKWRAQIENFVRTHVNLEALPDMPAPVVATTPVASAIISATNTDEGFVPLTEVAQAIINGEVVSATDQLPY